MRAPNALTDGLFEAYIRYLFSAHPVGWHNPELENLLRDRIRADHPLVRGPILELDSPSKSGVTVGQLIDEGVLCNAMGDLRAGGDTLVHRRLYTHLESAIRASCSGASVVVASGTGSGKTEAWLYSVVNEMLEHPRTGLRAVVLYPMNALADDQRRIRMRGLLSGTNVTYGEYTGNTPHDERDPNGSIDQDAPLNEIQTRQRLRETPPNILITNPSMLEYLLLRPEDNALFRGADLQFVILDEAHTYRGAYGIELGHLLRRLKARLCVTTLRSFVLSATIDKDIDAIARFAGNLTGESFAPSGIFFGELEPATVPAKLVHRPAHAYIILTPDVVQQVLSDPSNLLSVPGISAFGDERVISAASSTNGARALWELLHDDGHVAALQGLLRDGPRSTKDLAVELFGPQSDVNIDLAIAQLVDAAASARIADDSAALLPARYHVFMRGLDGVRVCFNPVHGDLGAQPFTIGTYYLENRDTCDCGFRLWELLVCGDCASWYVRGRGDVQSKGSSLSGIAQSFLIIDEDIDSDNDTSPLSLCLMCRAANCTCSAGARRAVISTADRKTCLVCAADNVAEVMTGTGAPTQILAEALTSEQDPDPTAGRGSGKKLLVFSDSRRSAAQFAAQLDRAHRQHIERAAIYHALKEAATECGLDELALRVAKILQAVGMIEKGPSGRFKGTAIAYQEFIQAYASRRRLGSLGLAASRIFFDEQNAVPSSLVSLVGSASDARAVTQALLEIIQYDSAVTKPELMPQLTGFAALRGDVRYGLTSGQKRWISPEVNATQRIARQFNLASRLVGAEQADRLLHEVWQYAVADGALVDTGGGFQISHERIVLEIPPRWYKCDLCRRITAYALSDGRGCVTKNCKGVLKVAANVPDETDHFVRNITSSVEYFTIEEHTAQIESHEARRIGKAFRDGKVNILSCSTTFELGVDIGTLQSVLMRNVPPTVANYRQRAGRAGRTRQGAAFLLTYCGGTPHDRVFFEHPTEIITGGLAIPEFHLQNAVLASRHLNSLFLASLWRFVSVRLGQREKVDTFLLADDASTLWPQWAEQHDHHLAREVELYGSGRNERETLGQCKQRFLEGLEEQRSWAKERAQALQNLLPTLSGDAQRNTLNELQRLCERRLIDYLSARAFLPSYAFPIFVVELHTQDDRVSLQRDLKIAISEYAPSNQVIANKKIFESVAVVLKRSESAAKTPYLAVQYCEQCLAAYPDYRDGCVCGADSLRSAQYIIPDGFTTDMTARAGIAVASARMRNARITQHVLSSGEKTESMESGPVFASKYEKATFLFLNHGFEGVPFSICLQCGMSVRRRGKAPATHKSPYGKSCAGSLIRCMLAHEVVGEALSLYFSPDDTLLVPDDKVFHETLSYALADGISKALSIERRDLGTTVHRVSRQGRMVWEILILDNVPGGAGYVAQIMRPGSLQRSIREAQKIASCANCPEETTCYSCLRSMWNQHVHEHMARGPVMRFLAALSQRLAGVATVYGLDLEGFIATRRIEEIILCVPTLNDWVFHWVSELALQSQVTVVVATVDPSSTSRAIAWQRMIWPPEVRLLVGAERTRAICLRTGHNWEVLADLDVGDLSDGRLYEGVLLDGESARSFCANVLSGSRQIGSPLSVPADLITLPAGRAASEKELFGHLFDGVVDAIIIEDPYLCEARLYERLAAWLSLTRTAATVTIQTSKPEDQHLAREQSQLFTKLQRAFPQHHISIRYLPRRQMHDRHVKIRGEISADISLPKGLDFIGTDGRIAKDTSATVVMHQR